MTWLTWRQFRLPASTVAAIVAVIAVILAITVSRLDRPGTGEEYLANLPAGTDPLYFGSLIAMYVLPAVIGVFWGAPLVARELEAGTHRLVWNQSVTRTRWLAVKIGLPGLAAMAVAGLASLVVGWWASPIDAAASSLNSSGSITDRITPLVFVGRGVVPMGYAAFAFILGVTAGVVLRRTVAAMAVTLVLFIAVQLLVPVIVRPYLIPPVEQSVSITDANVRQISANDLGQLESIRVVEVTGVWMLGNETIDPSGNVASTLPTEVTTCLPGQPRTSSSPPPDIRVVRACVAKLDDLGYSQRLTYQPGSRFWALQWLELGMFLVLSGLLTWFCFRWTRHRLS